MDDLSLISKELYRGLIRMRAVGPESGVRMRRLVMDLEHEIKNVTFNFNPMVEAIYLSGSEAEGLRFSSSDRDFMYVIRDIRIIFSLSQLQSHSNTVLLAECEGLKPGFALLRLVTNSNFVISNPCVNHNNSYFVSNILWRNQFVKNAEIEGIHGPCTSFAVGDQEYDFAYCIKSDTWPDAALGCVGRLRNAGWPSHEVLSKIINDGCLFVPIGSKNSPYEEYEWRLSFSLAEKRLIHSMNHNQFVTYGLLKTFLKEAIDTNPEVNGLLCSYFLKTILFWKIIREDQWMEINFLHNFWKCFQSLIACVITGYCPNFFIPENNMFRGKIEGKAQRKLLSHLTFLHDTGYRCLLQCPSVQGFMLQIFQQPILALTLPKDQWNSGRICIEFIREILKRRIPLHDEQAISLASFLHAESLLCHSPSLAATFVVKTWMKMFLPHLCVMLTKQNHRRNNASQKLLYTTDRFIMKAIMSSSCDSISHLIYAAIALYHSANFAAAINIIKKGKGRLQNPCLIYPWYLDEDKYRAAGGDTTPIGEMMRTVIAFPVDLRLVTCIPGLELEHEAARLHYNDMLTIPPFVIANFLLFLCYLREQNTVQASTVLDELSILVHLDDGRHIHDTGRSISWQLLGICQEMSGDYQGAYYSYNVSMQQRWCPIKSASKLRIGNMCSYLAYHYNHV